MIIYVSIGNSDDKLKQAAWCDYARRVRAEVRNFALRVHGEWYSAPDAKYQNACFCIELTDRQAGYLRQALGDTAATFKQDSIAWAVAETEFIGPAVTP